MKIIKTETVKKRKLKYMVITFNTAVNACKHAARLRKRNISCATDGIKVVFLRQI